MLGTLFLVMLVVWAAFFYGAFLLSALFGHRRSPSAGAGYHDGEPNDYQAH